MFLLESGSIDIGICSSEGQRLTLNVLGPGDVFGEIAMLDGGPRTADAVARVESQVRSLDRDHFFSLFPSEVEAYEYVVKLLCQRLRWTNRNTEHSLLSSARVRLASRLLMLGDGDAQGWIRVNQQELADMSGIVREWVNRLVKEWESEGIVGCERGAVRILERQALMELVEPEV